MLASQNWGVLLLKQRSEDFCQYRRLKNSEVYIWNSFENEKNETFHRRGASNIIRILIIKAPMITTNYWLCIRFILDFYRVEDFTFAPFYCLIVTTPWNFKKLTSGIRFTSEIRIQNANYQKNVTMFSVFHSYLDGGELFKISSFYPQKLPIHPTIAH